MKINFYNSTLFLILAITVSILVLAFLNSLIENKTVPTLNFEDSINYKINIANNRNTGYITIDSNIYTNDDIDKANYFKEANENDIEVIVPMSIVRDLNENIIKETYENTKQVTNLEQTNKYKNQKTYGN